MVKYVYDAWGNHKVLNPNGTENTAEDFIGNINPIRYRSYYYDVETGLYYLNARYYDPETCRFISPDSVDYLDPETIGGTNLYAYCNNNPVMYVDPDGHGLISILIGIGVSALIGALSGAASYAVGQLISFAVTGKWSWSWGGFLGSVIGGAIGGIVSGGFNLLGSKILSSITSTTGKIKSLVMSTVSKLLVKTGSFASGFSTKFGNMLGENISDNKGYSLKEISFISTTVGMFSLYFNADSSTSLFDDIEASLSGASSKTIGKIFATELSNNFYDGMGPFFAEFYYSLFGFERLTLQFIN